MVTRYYLDTSVFGGYFDIEFEEKTKKLFAQIGDKGDRILYSDYYEMKQELLEDGKIIHVIPVTEWLLGYNLMT